MHREHAIPALESGKYVFLEKPMAITIQDCDEILRTAERCGGRLYVGHNMRFFPVMQKMQELISQGRIGQVEAIWCRHFVGDGGDYYFKNYNSERDRSTSLLLQKGAHDIDIIHWLAGAYTQWVSGMGKLSVYNRVTDRREPGHDMPRGTRDPSLWPPLAQKGLNPIIDVEDHNMLMMQLSNGVQASYMQCFYTPAQGSVLASCFFGEIETRAPDKPACKRREGREGTVDFVNRGGKWKMAEHAQKKQEARTDP